MKVTHRIIRLFALMACAVLFFSLAWVHAAAAKTKTVAQWLEGYQTGEVWFGDDFAYDITDTAACWELLMQPIVVLDVPENTTVALLKEPNGAKVNTDKLGGAIAGQTAAVHVLGKDENGWTLIEGVDDYNRVMQGYVRTKLLKTVTPNKNLGLIIDKLTQRMYIFVEGELFSSVAISTGTPNDEQPYNETSAGEYLLISWVGGFDSEGMYCDMAIRFNNGDLIHEVPHTVLADGTKRYSKWESQLGQKASHGCIRVQRLPNEDGVNQKWLWDNMKRMTKVLIWDDAGRLHPYPEDDTQLFYNPDGGKYYHSTPECSTVKTKYHPLTAFTYGELDTGAYAKLEPCAGCTPVKRKSVIDQENIARGAITQEELDALYAQTAQDGAATTSVSSLAHIEDTFMPEASPHVNTDAAEDGDVEIIIVRATDEP